MTRMSQNFRSHHRNGSIWRSLCLRSTSTITGPSIIEARCIPLGTSNLFGQNIPHSFEVYFRERRTLLPLSSHLPLHLGLHTYLVPIYLEVRTLCLIRSFRWKFSFLKIIFWKRTSKTYEGIVYCDCLPTHIAQVDLKLLNLRRTWKFQRISMSSKTADWSH